jgi:hypothetical protein
MFAQNSNTATFYAGKCLILLMPVAYEYADSINETQDYFTVLTCEVCLYEAPNRNLVIIVGVSKDAKTLVLN